MVIATFNCNSIRTRLPIITDWIQVNSPDALALQETKVQDEHFPVDAFTALGYTPVYRGEKSYNGVAWIVKGEVDDVMYGFDETESEGTRIISVKKNGIWLVNTYIPQGYSIESGKYAYKLRWFDLLRDYFYSRFSSDRPLIWCGDFNVALTDIDVHDPKRLAGHVCFNPEVQKKLSEINEFGFVDIIRKYNPERDTYTFWDYRVKDGVDRKVGWRIDYIQATESIAGYSTRCWIDIDVRRKARPSDHTIVAADFDMPV
ncbi:MAG: exodeoxyribonuclease III [Spirochaetota bacterium]